MATMNVEETFLGFQGQITVKWRSTWVGWVYDFGIALFTIYLLKIWGKIEAIYLFSKSLFSLCRFSSISERWQEYFYPYFTYWKSKYFKEFAENVFLNLDRLVFRYILLTWRSILKFSTRLRRTTAKSTCKTNVREMELQNF